MPNSSDLRFARARANHPSPQAQDLLEDPPPQPVPSAKRAQLDGYPLLLGIPHLVRLFDKSPRTIRDWMRIGKLPVIRIGRQRFVPRAAIEKILGEALGAAEDHFFDEDSFVNQKANE